MHLAYCLLKVLPTAYLLCYLLCYPQYNLRSAWQVLSQSKTLFTAGLMYALVGKRLSHQQVLLLATGYLILTLCGATHHLLLTACYLLLLQLLAVFLLIVGAVLVQLQVSSRHAPAVSQPCCSFGLGMPQLCCR